MFRAAWLLAVSRSIARRLVDPALWPLIDEELRAEIDERRETDSSGWHTSLWGGAEYLSVAGRMTLERVISLLRRLAPWRGPMQGGWAVDLRVAVRGLRTRSGSAATIVATLALAIGATTSVFSVVEGVLLRPLPYPEPDRLVRVWQTRADWRDAATARMREYADRMSVLAPTLREWAATDLGFEALGGYLDASFVLQGADRAEVVRGQEVTSAFFEVLGLEPVLGRGLAPTDDALDAPRVALVSEQFRREYLGNQGDPVGTDLILDGVAHTVVGVLPDGVRVPQGDMVSQPLAGTPQVWTPLAEEAWHGNSSINVIGRLGSGVSFDAAVERLTAKQTAMAGASSGALGDRGVRVLPLLEALVLDVRSTLWFLLAAGGLVLLVATVNIVNLLTAVGLTRRHDLAVRGALGAGPGRLARGLLVESGVLTGLGGACGILVAWLTLPGLVRLLPESIPRLDSIGMSLPVLLFGLLVTCGAALLVGLLPMLLNGRAEPQEVLRASGRAATAGRTTRRLRSALVVVEVSLAFVLLLGAALLARSYHELWTVDRGFRTEGLVTLRVEPDPLEYPGWEGMRRFNAALRARFEEIPGVSASVSNNVPLTGEMAGMEISVDRGGEILEGAALLSVGSENYFDVVGVPLVAGRTFTDRDTREAPAVAIVNQTFAREFWPGEQAVGQRVLGDDGWSTVVGVSADVRHQGLDTPVDPKVYLPSSQSRRDTYQWVLRVQGSLPDAVRRATDAVSALSPTTPVSRVLVLEQAIDESVSVPRFRTLLIGALALLAALLALLGVYGVLAFAVAQRTKELGVRIALGARPDRLVAEVVGSGLKLTAIGTVLGLLASWRLGDTLSEFLFGISANDLPTYSAITVGLLLVGGAAAFLPARRAATVDPTAVLSAD